MRQTQDIGTIDNGIDGYDQYVLITDRCEALNLDEVHNWLLELSCYSTDRPGGSFCNLVTIVPKPDYPHECIGIIHHRYDV